jgi:hypothetical protein
MDWWIGPADMKVAIRELTVTNLYSLSPNTGTRLMHLKVTMADQQA